MTLHNNKRLTPWTKAGRVLSLGISRLLPLDSSLSFEITSYPAFIDNLPPVFESFKIVQLSDTHFYEFSCPLYYQSVVDRVNQLKPDLIVLTGDVIHYGNSYLYYGNSFLQQLKATTGKFACMGNHDYNDDYRGEALKEMLRESGFSILVNQAFPIEQEGKKLWISGVDDYKKGCPDLEKAYISVQKDDFHLSITHNPLLADFMVKAKSPPQLIFAGHTHGGQIKHWLVDWMHNSILKVPYRHGWFNLGFSQLYVSSGIGSASMAIHMPYFDFALCPFRINTKPEIVLFELTGMPLGNNSYDNKHKVMVV